jgi:hypothetical protein
VVGQFFDLGAGLPTKPAVHHTVREVNAPREMAAWLDGLDLVSPGMAEAEIRRDLDNAIRRIEAEGWEHTERSEQVCGGADVPEI